MEEATPRPWSRTRLLLVGCLLPVAVLLIAGGDRSARAQFGVVARAEGTVVFKTDVRRSLTAPASAGTQVTVLAVRSALDTTVCGVAFTDAEGGYAVDIADVDDCAAPAQPDRCLYWVFVVHNQNAGVAGCESEFGAEPVHYVGNDFGLTADFIPLYQQMDPAAGLEVGQGGFVLPYRLLHGQITLAAPGSNPPLRRASGEGLALYQRASASAQVGQPAPAGTMLTAWVRHDACRRPDGGFGGCVGEAAAPAMCGSSNVYDGRGSYVVAVEPTPACTPTDDSPVIQIGVTLAWPPPTDGFCEATEPDDIPKLAFAVAVDYILTLATDTPSASPPSPAPSPRPVPSPPSPPSPAPSASPERVPLVEILSDSPADQARVRDCYAMFLRWGGVAAQLARDLDLNKMVARTAPRIGINIDHASTENHTQSLAATAEAAAETFLRADGTAGAGASALITVNPTLTTPYTGNIPRPFCMVLLHELFHARDIISGTVPPGQLPLRGIRLSTIELLDGTALLDCGEIKTLVNENRARKLLQPPLGTRGVYEVPGHDQAFLLPGINHDDAPLYPEYNFSVVDPPQEPFDAGPCGRI